MSDTSIEEILKRKTAECDYLMLFIVSIANNVAHDTIVEAISEMCKTKRYKHSVKQNARLALAACEDAEKMFIRHTVGSVFIEYVDKIQEYLDKDVQMLYMAIKQRLDRHNVEDSMLVARVATAKVLVMIACSIYDILIRKMETILHHEISMYLATHKDCSVSFSYLQSKGYLSLRSIYDKLRYTTVQHCWGKATEPFGIPAGIDIATDKNYILARNIIIRKISDTAIKRDAAQSVIENFNIIDYGQVCTEGL